MVIAAATIEEIINECQFFQFNEFECSCGCKLNNISVKLALQLDEARDVAGIPFKITSGTRCEEYNISIGGSMHSAHVDGWAADIAAKNSSRKFKIVKALLDTGFNRIEVATRHIHVDIDPTKSQFALWTGISK